MNVAPLILIQTQSELSQEIDKAELYKFMITFTQWLENHGWHMREDQQQLIALLQQMASMLNSPEFRSPDQPTKTKALNMIQRLVSQIVDEYQDLGVQLPAMDQIKAGTWNVAIIQQAMAEVEQAEPPSAFG